MTASYLALADSIEADMAALGPGTKLPSEHQLCSARRVSRITARGALQELERRHLVRRTRGSGTFTARRIPYPIRPGTSPSWSQIVRTSGHTPTYRIRRVDRVDACASTAAALQIDAGTPLVRIERVGSIDGEAAAHQLMHFPLDCFDLDADRGAVVDATASMRALLAEQQSTTTLLAERFGIDLERSATRAELHPIDAERGAELELNGRPMAWRIETVNRCRRSRRPLEVTETWLRADSFQVFMELGPTDGPFPFPTPPPTTPPPTTPDNERFS